MKNSTIMVVFVIDRIHGIQVAKVSFVPKRAKEQGAIANELNKQQDNFDFIYKVIFISALNIPSHKVLLDSFQLSRYFFRYYTTFFSKGYAWISFGRRGKNYNIHITAFIYYTFIIHVCKILPGKYFISLM